ncbi:hypothetical protein SSJG_04687 [Escherichia coli D9]|nr:hypothetical protein SSJG_04687 [Escherichia coli D9]
MSPSTQGIKFLAKLLRSSTEAWIGQAPTNKSFLSVAIQLVAALASFIRTSHIVSYAPGDSLSCRLATTRISRIYVCIKHYTWG